MQIAVGIASPRVHPARGRIRSTLVFPLEGYAARTTTHLRVAAAATASTTARIAGLPLRTLGKILRNALLGVAVAWLQTVVVSYGDVFSGDRSEQQSRASFVVASMVWQHVFFCAVVFAIHVVLLRQERLLSAPRTQSSYAACIALLAPTCAAAFIATSLAVVGAGVCIARLPAAVFEALHANLYALPVCAFPFVVAAHWKTRLVVRSQTVRGQARRQLQMRQQEWAERHGQPPPRPRRRRSLVLDVVCRDLPFLLSVTVATGFVHLVESLRMETTWHLLAFAAGSLVAKAAIQELAKHYLLRIQRTPPLRVMAVVIATPTILVDTQLRMVLMCESASRFSPLVSVALALAEISVRVAKSLLVKRQVRRAETTAARTMRASQGGKAPGRRQSLTWDGHYSIRHSARRSIRHSARHSVRNSARDVASSETASIVAAALSIKLGALHTAEVVADMYAEYMAMGCSYGALLLLRGHPRFETCSFRGAAETAALDASAAREPWELLGTAALQLALEAAVDVAACALEARVGGADFAQFNQDDAFFVVFLVAIAAVNMGVTCSVTLVP